MKFRKKFNDFYKDMIEQLLALTPGTFFDKNGDKSAFY